MYCLETSNYDYKQYGYFFIPVNEIGGQKKPG